jgi:ABC-2 type transport system permease protein
MLHWLLGRVAARSLRSSYSTLRSMGRRRRRGMMNGFDRVVLRISSPLPGAMRQMLVKDLRIFRRDPVQWTQLAIFLGLLMLYFFNVRRLDYTGALERWVILVSFFNVAVVGLLLSTFTTRFVLPMISLEGRRFWVLGTAPIHRDTIVWGKFWFSFGGAILPCAAMVLLSDLALRVHLRSPAIVLIHQVICLALCSGLSALAVGFGARLPNMRETSPSKIAAGFGGTLNLVVSSLYILAVVLPIAIPCFFWWRMGPSGQAGGLRVVVAWFGLGTTSSVVLGLAFVTVLGVLATALPLRMGLRAFRRLEF